MTRTFYDGFCGIGGFRIPLQEMGWTCIGGCDIDPHARAVYRERFSEFPSGMDIRKIEPREIPDHDMFCGGFPCPTWSIAGKRLGFKDPRGELVNEIFRIIREKRPRLLLLENVKGLLSHDRGRSFAVILDALDELGYDVEWQVLNSKYWVPQNRERVFIIGHLRGKPWRQVFPLGEGSQINASPCRKAQEEGARLSSQITGTIDKYYYKSGAGSRTHITSPKIITTEKLNKGQSGLVCDSEGISRTVSSKGRGRHGLVKEPRMKKLGNIAGTDHDSMWGRVYDPEGVSQTINAQGGGLGAKTGLIVTEDLGMIGHVVIDENSKKLFPKEQFKNKRIRRLTPLECERLQGFPDNWTKITYKGKTMSDQKRYECIGNAVTVDVVRDIVRNLA